GDPAALLQRERQLQDMGLTVPRSLEAGHKLLETLRGQLGALEDDHTLGDAALAAAAKAASLAALVEQAQLAVAHARAAVHAATQAGDPAEQVRDLEEKAAAQRTVVAAAEHRARTAAGSDVEWP